MAADRTLALLGETLPPWLLFPVVSQTAILGFAAPSGTRWQRVHMDVTIEASLDIPIIRETKPLRLPSWCPELHLNSDRSFCLGLEAKRVADRTMARQWWADIEVHLRLLSVALNTRVWPQHSALDHGDAGQYQRAARRSADRLGLAEDYARSQSGESNWIADAQHELVARDGRLQPVVCPCPFNCGRHKGRSRLLRNCPRRKSIAGLILLERARRLELQAFWAKAGESGQACCGKMRDCPLANGLPEAPADDLLARARTAASAYVR